MSELKSRKSPLGYDEYSVPKDKESEYFEPLTLATTYPDRRVFYKENSFNDPEVQHHERIHVGQFGLDSLPSAAETDKAIAPILPWTLSSSQITGDPRFEVPAYAFENLMDSSLRNKQQQAFNQYLNLVYQKNREKTPRLEAQMPEALWHEYVRNVPRPILPPKIDMQEVPLWKGLFNSSSDLQSAGSSERKKK